MIRVDDLDKPSFLRRNPELAKRLLGVAFFGRGIVGDLDRPSLLRRDPSKWELINGLNYRKTERTLLVDPSTLSEEELDEPAFLRQSRERE